METTMQIGWYPGHMNKARKEIIQSLKKVHAILEIVDARLPYSSQNPLLQELAGDKPSLLILNKSDLADPDKTSHWLDYFTAENRPAITACGKNPGHIQQQVVQHFNKLKSSVKPPFRIMVAGIPNVGKSTLINILAGRKIAKTGNEPAVTKGQQEIRLDTDLCLLDTPGILWPKIENQDSAYRLAMTGAIRNTAIEFEDIALYAVNFLCRAYPAALVKRYQLDDLNQDPVFLLEEIGRKRGCLKRGGVDFNKTGEALLNDLRAGKLGLLSMEMPYDIPVPVVEESTEEV